MPGFNQKSADEFTEGFNNSGTDPVKLAGQIAKYMSAQPHKAPGTSVGDPSLLSYENQPMNEHTMNMQQAAEEAKQKYMKENGVDENGDPVAKEAL